jgi:predicted Zn-dependent peptidase
MDHQRYAAKILATILGDDSGSRLYWELVDPGLAEYVSMGHQEHLDAGIYLTFMSCQAENAKKNLELVHATYEKAAADGIDPEELTRAKSKVLSRIVLASERPRGRLFGVGSEWVQRREYFSMKDDIDILKSITLDEIHQVLEQYPLTENQTILVGPLKE